MSSHAAEHDDIGDLIRQTIFALGGGSAADAEAAKERVEAARTAIRAKILDFQKERSRITASDRVATEIAIRATLLTARDCIQEATANMDGLVTELTSLMPVVMLSVPLTDAELADDPEAVDTVQNLLSVLEADRSSTIGPLIDWASLKRVEQSFPKFKEIWEWSRRRLLDALPAQSSGLTLMSALGGDEATLKGMLDADTDVQKYHTVSLALFDKMTEYDLKGREDVSLADRVANACAQRLLDLEDFTISQGESSTARSIFGKKAEQYPDISAFQAAAELCQESARSEIKEISSGTAGGLLGDTSWITKPMRKAALKNTKSKADVTQFVDTVLTMALMREIMKATNDQPNALKQYRARVIIFSLEHDHPPAMAQMIAMLSKSELQSQRAAVQNGMANNIIDYLDYKRLTQEVSQMISEL